MKEHIYIILSLYFSQNYSMKGKREGGWETKINYEKYPQLESNNSSGSKNDIKST